MTSHLAATILPFLPDHLRGFTRYFDCWSFLVFFCVVHFKNTGKMHYNSNTIRVYRNVLIDIGKPNERYMPNNFLLTVIFFMLCRFYADDLDLLSDSKLQKNFSFFFLRGGGGFRKISTWIDISVFPIFDSLQLLHLENR